MKSSQNVTPINSVAPYIGGKRNLARTIVGRIGAIEHRTYVEQEMAAIDAASRRRKNTLTIGKGIPQTGPGVIPDPSQTPTHERTSR